MTETQLDPAEQAVFDALAKLVEVKPNVSYVLSYVYSSSKDPAQAEPIGRMTMAGSVEEAQIHIDGLQAEVTKQKQVGDKKKGKIYGNKQP